MKRLLRVSLDIFVTSVVPIAQCFLIGMLLDANLINIFTLTYPLQFVITVLKSIFGTGANIFACKENNQNVIDCGIVLGVVVGGAIFGTVACQIENYIQFMNMDVEIYRIFGIYSVMQLYLQFILQLILTKLYYKEENKKANQIAIQFNVLTFVFVIGLAILTKSQILTVAISLLVLFIYAVLLLLASIEKFEFEFHLFKSITYDSVDFFNGITFILIYLFGFKNVFSFGEHYVLAMTFVTLVTDMQWDILHAIIVVAKVDISKKNFVYQKHLENAYKLNALIIASIFMMVLLFYGKYQPDLKLVALFMGAEIIMLVMYPIYILKTCYLQLEYSAVKTTLNKEIANLIRMILSATLLTPYCVSIAQLVSMCYQLIYTKIFWLKKEDKLENLPERKAECN